MIARLHALLFGVRVTITGPDGAVSHTFDVPPAWRRWLSRWF